MAQHPVVSAASASTTDFPAGQGRAGTDFSRATPRAISSLFPSRNFYVGLILATLTVGALSLLIPSTPSYDPWSWLVWSRQIIHGHLTITSGGTSWKPLPMIFTIPFALFGKAAPDLWLVVARAGALAAVVMVFRLAFRLTRRVGGLSARPTPALAVSPPPPRAARRTDRRRRAGLSASGGFVSSNALGYSEGFAAALLLIAIDRHLDGKPRQAFVVGFLVALDRPEIWAFWGPYGLWLFWRDPGVRSLVVVLFVLQPIVWFVPVYWGSGTSAAASAGPRTRARTASRSRLSRSCAELKRAAWPTMLLRIKVVAGAPGRRRHGILWRRRPRRLAGLRTERSQARLTAALMRGRRARLVRGHRDHDPGRLLGQQPLSRAGVGAGRHLRRGRLRLGCRSRSPCSSSRRRGAGRRGAMAARPRCSRGVRVRSPTGSATADLDPAHPRFARLPGTAAKRRDRSGQPLRRRRQGPGLRQRDDRGLPGADGGLRARRAHHADRGAADPAARPTRSRPRTPRT